VFIDDRDRLACLVTFAQVRFKALTVMAGLVSAIHVVQLRRLTCTAPAAHKPNRADGRDNPLMTETA
jgi:hypothetical protein